MAAVLIVTGVQGKGCPTVVKPVGTKKHVHGSVMCVCVCDAGVLLTELNAHWSPSCLRLVSFNGRHQTGTS